MTSRARMLAAIAALATVAGGALAAAGSAAPRPTTLFSISASNAVITGTGATARISVPSGSPLVWFSDRPARTAGYATADALVASWSLQRFDASPPNAAVVATRGGRTTQAVAVLTSPRRSVGRVSFRFRVLPDHRMLGMSTTGQLPRGRYSRLSLFVDAAPIPFCPAAFDGATTVGTTPATGYRCLLTAGSTYRVTGQSPRLNVQGCHPANSTGGGVRTGGGIAYGYVDWVQDLTIGPQTYYSNDYGSTGPLPICNAQGTLFGQIADEYAVADSYEQSSLRFTSSDGLTLFTTYRAG